MKAIILPTKLSPKYWDDMTLSEVIEDIETLDLTCDITVRCNHCEDSEELPIRECAIFVMAMFEYGANVDLLYRLVESVEETYIDGDEDLLHFIITV